MGQLGGRLFWIASYVRSGSTWQRMFLYCLTKILQGEIDQPDVNVLHHFSPSDNNRIYYGKYLPWDRQNSIQEIAPFREAIQSDIAKDTNEFVKERNGYVFVRTRWLLGRSFGHHNINLAAAAGSAYLVRNPLDVAVSLAHYMNRPIEFAIDFMGTPNAFTGGDTAACLMGSWSQNVESWTRHPEKSICVMRYEDMLKDPLLWFTILSRHIFRDPPTQAQITRAIEQSSFEVLKEQEETAGWYADRPKETKKFFREGSAGQWKTVLTAHQIDKIVETHREQMTRFGYLPNAI
jgi:hypothetical protein